MKVLFRSGLVAVGLLSSGAAAALAAEPKASDQLTLTSAQEHAIYQSALKQDVNMKAPAGFTATIGAKVPAKIGLHTFPADVTGQLPALKPFEYAMVDNKVIIVNPMDRKVVDIVAQ
jgi:Protein of unknown function (DUF1236)